MISVNNGTSRSFVFVTSCLKRAVRIIIKVFIYVETTTVVSLLQNKHCLSITMAVAAAQGKLLAVIGDEDTCVGFLLGGIGEYNKKRDPNFLVVGKNTSVQEIEETYKKFVKRDDIDIILINQNIAEQIRHVIDSDNDNPLPAVLEIPSKDHPYDPAKDSVLRRAKGLYSAEDMR